jgi:molybdate transport system substrate-binding protein
MTLIRTLIAALSLTASSFVAAAPDALLIGAVPSLGPAIDVLQQRFAETHPEVTIKVRIAPGATLANTGAADAPGVLLLDSRERAAPLAVGDSLTVLGDGLLAIYTNTPGINTGRGAPLFIADYITGIAIGDPATSPFGAITRSVMDRLTVLETAERKFKPFADDAAAAAAVKAAQVDIGLIPVPLLVSAAYRNAGSSTALPLGLYTPATYVALITAAGQDSAAARAFIAFLRADSTRPLLTEVGIPPASVP